MRGSHWLCSNATDHIGTERGRQWSKKSTIDWPGLASGGQYRPVLLLVLAGGVGMAVAIKPEV
jgi:hypothetical protein